MNSECALTLTAADRVLIHLRDYMHHADDREFPPAMAQKGISESTGLRLSHVPRTIKGLEERGLIGSVKGHIAGEKRRYNVYFLTEEGLAEANRVLRNIGDETVRTPKGSIRVREILDKAKGPTLPVLRELAGEAVDPKQKACLVAGPMPATEGFVNREQELGELILMLDSPNVKVMVIYGSVGFGTSALASKFAAESSKRRSIVWVENRKSLQELLSCILNTAAEILPGIDKSAKTPKKLAEQFHGSNAMIVLDGYYEASDDVVEFLTGFVAAVKETPGFKLLVTAREDTPSYNRFYTIIDQHDGTVGEVHIRGLDLEHCQVLLGTPDIDPDAMKRLFLFSRGKPATLRLLAKGNEKELRQNTSFSPEEIKLMLFLKGQKKE